MKNPSRRSVCKNSLYIVSATMLLAARALADALQSQASVSYQTTPNDGQQCSGCKNFIPGGALGACKVVDGTISPSGYCVAFEPI